MTNFMEKDYKIFEMFKNDWALVTAGNKDDFKASSLPSLLAAKNSLDAIEKVALIPMINPLNAINLVFCIANVNPASEPVNSTKAE